MVTPAKVEPVLKKQTTIYLFLLCLLILGGILRFPQTLRGLPASKNADAVKTVGVAQHISSAWRKGQLIVDPGVYQYPTFYAQTLAASTLFFGSKGNHHFIARFNTMMAGLLLVIVAFVLGKTLSGATAGLGAAGLISFGLVFILQGRFPNADALQTLLIGLCFLFLVINQQRSLKTFILAGFVGGLAVGTKYTALVYLLPFVVGLLFFPGTQVKLSQALKRLLVFIMMIPVGFLVTTPSFLIVPSKFLDRMTAESKIQAVGTVGIPDAHFLDYLFPIREGFVADKFPNPLTDVMGWPFTLFALIVLFLWGREGITKKDPVKLSFFATVVISYLFFALVSNIHPIRFLLPLILLLVVMVSISCVDITKSFHRWIPFLILVLLMSPSLSRSLTYFGATTKPDPRLLAAQWVIQHVPKGEKILVLMHGPTLPSQLFDLVFWSFPEYKFKPIDPNQGPSLDRLEKEGIQWVVWNDIYTDRFINNELETENADYIRTWKRFYQDMIDAAGPKGTVKFKGVFAPTIEIYNMDAQRQHESTKS